MTCHVTTSYKIRDSSGLKFSSDILSEQLQSYSTFGNFPTAYYISKEPAKMERKNIYHKNDTKFLTLTILSLDLGCFENSVDPDQSV